MTFRAFFVAKRGVAGALLGVAALLCVAAAPAGAASTSVVVGQVLTRGTGGANDEFVELYNASQSPVDVAGWKLDVFNASGMAGNSAIRATIPAGSTLGAGCHYLIAGTAYAGSATPDLVLSAGLPDAVGLALLNSSGTVVDAVGMAFDATTMNAGFGMFAEGAPLDTVHDNTTAHDIDSGFERKPGGILGEGQDTDQNTDDFAVVAPTDPQGTASACVSPMTATGAASPANPQQAASALLTVAVTPGAPSPSNGFAVTADLSAIGGSATQPLYDDATHGDVTAADDTFSFDAPVATTASVGSATIPVTISDAQGRRATAAISLTIASQPASPPPTSTPTSTPTPTPTPTPPPTPIPIPIPTPTPPGAKSFSARATEATSITRSVLSARGLSIKLTCSAACRYGFSLQASSSVARRLKLTTKSHSSKAVTVGSKTGTTTSTSTVTVKLTSGAKRALARLRHGTSVRLTLVLEAKPASGKTVTRDATITVKG